MCYKPSVGIGFYFLLWFSKGLVYVITFDSTRYGWHYDQDPQFWNHLEKLKTKKTKPRCSGHAPAQLNQKLLMWDPLNSRVSSSSLDDSNVQPSLRTTNLEFKFEAIPSWKLLIIQRKLKCEMILSNMWCVIRESTRLGCVEPSSSSGPALVTGSSACLSTLPSFAVNSIHIITIYWLSIFRITW